MEALVTILPIALLVLACPLMMIFMHRGHGGGGHAAHGNHGAGADASTRIAELERELTEMKRGLAAAPQAKTDAPSINSHKLKTSPQRAQPIERSHRS